MTSRWDRRNPSPRTVAAGPARRPPGAAPRRHARSLGAVALVVGWSIVACSGDDGGDHSGGDAREATTTASGDPVLEARDEPLPVVTPTPREMRWLGPDVVVPRDVDLVAADDVDTATTDTVTEVLRGAGARRVRLLPPDDRDRAAAPLVVDIGPIGAEPTASPLRDARLELPDDVPADGYALAAFTREGGTAEIVLAGADAAGTFYAAQTLRQLVTGAGDAGGADTAAIAGVGVVDHPAMHHRGAIEGFYGSPWTAEERLDQLAFYGRFKLNTYIYAPKDDPYHRDRWREPYPADLVAGLRSLIDRAAANHVRFTFAVSPGVSICYSDPADRDALVAKLDAVYQLGVRAFSVALDDIVHTRWNCDGDHVRYGAPSSEAAARAQVELLNALQRGFIAGHEGAQPLQMVPTEYRGTDDSPYRRVIREQLDPAVEVMWTGSMVVPPEITVDEAAAAAAVFGRPTLVWDNTPVNDYPATEGRLILAPYDRRQPGLSAGVTGIVLNPMNQAAASKVQLIGAADFGWNDAGYDPARAQRAAAAYLSAGTGGRGADPATLAALLAFFDLENLAPTSATAGTVSQPQAPALAQQLDAFGAAWDRGDPSGAVSGLRPYAQLLAGAPRVIDRGVADRAFIADAQPWLDATALWGQALVASLDALDAQLAGDAAGAQARFADADALADRATAIETIPGETRPQGPVRVGDGVLDAFIAGAPALS